MCMHQGKIEWPLRGVLPHHDKEVKLDFDVCLTRDCLLRKTEVALSLLCPAMRLATQVRCRLPCMPDVLMNDICPE